LIAKHSSGSLKKKFSAVEPKSFLSVEEKGVWKERKSAPVKKTALLRVLL
jgi:hypothetical protein